MEIHLTRECSGIKFEIDGKTHIGTVTEIPIYGRLSDFVGFSCKVKFSPPIIPFPETKKINILGAEVEFYCGGSDTIIEFNSRETSLLESF